MAAFAAYADKRGGGTSFLFGRKTWKKRYFVIDPEENSLAYWESSSHQKSNAPPLKPQLSLDGASVDVPAQSAATNGDRETWPFSVRFAPGSGDKSELFMRTDDREARDQFLHAFAALGLKVTGPGAPAKAAPSPSPAGAGGASPATGSGSGSRPVSSSRGPPPITATLHDDHGGSTRGAGASARPDAAAPAPAPPIAPTREVALSSSSSTKTPPPPPPRITSTSLGIVRPEASGPVFAAAVASRRQSVAAVQLALGETSAGGAGDGEVGNVSGAAASPAGAPAPPPAPPATPAPASDEPRPPAVPKPAAPSDAPPPEVEAAAREAQLRQMEQEEALPPGWTLGTTPDGFVFYVNPEGASQWDKPTA